MIVVDVLPADSAERTAQVRAVLTLAFAEDPVTRWLLPTAAAHLAFWPRMVDVMARDAFDGGTAWLAGDALGAVTWLTPGTAVDGEALGTVAGECTPAGLEDEVEEFFGRIDEYHPHGEHWYLPLLGVDPTARGRGIGSVLLAETLTRVDAAGDDAYLTSSNPRNVSLYRRHGFEVLGEVQVGSSPVMTPMFRPRRGQATAPSANPS